MTIEEAFLFRLSGLQPHLCEQVGANVHKKLGNTIAIAQRIEVYHGGSSGGQREQG